MASLKACLSLSPYIISPKKVNIPPIEFFVVCGSAAPVQAIFFFVAVAVLALRGLRSSLYQKTLSQLRFAALKELLFPQQFNQVFKRIQMNTFV